jgi:hypothetical protein
MRRLLGSTVLFLALLAVSGCGSKDDLMPLRGRILKAGEKFEAGNLEIMQVIFVPILPNGEAPRDHYYANVNDLDATFVVAGKTGRGLPPGKYRVSLELMKQKKDQFHGRYDAVNSPYIFEVDGTTKEVVIDIERPPGLR